ncbi:MAG: epoxyqueuosine reductase [Clostridia bacterium]|nr:epoxyqueuosine reductase [Clostridia bacterium]
MKISASDVKKIAAELGANLCGVAPIERFDSAPRGYHPCDVLPECQSVIVIAKYFLKSSLYANSTIPYTTVRNSISDKLNSMAIELSQALESRGVIAVPANTIGPDEWDSDTQRIRGIISLKHAAANAGLGKIGKNTLLVNKDYGNMIWLNAVLVSEKLEPDPLADYEVCNPNCNLCIKSCPVEALDGISINQPECRDYAFGEHNGGDWRIKCFTCRKVCPNCTGIS